MILGAAAIVILIVAGVLALLMRRARRQYTDLTPDEYQPANDDRDSVPLDPIASSAMVLETPVTDDELAVSSDSKEDDSDAADAAQEFQDSATMVGVDINK